MRVQTLMSLAILCSACTVEPAALPVSVVQPTGRTPDAVKTAIPDAAPRPTIRSYGGRPAQEPNSVQALIYGHMAGELFGLAGKCGVDRARIETDIDRARRYALASFQPITNNAFDAAIETGMRKWAMHPFSNPDYYCRNIDRDLAGHEAALARSGQ